MKFDNSKRMAALKDVLKEEKKKKKGSSRSLGVASSGTASVSSKGSRGSKESESQSSKSSRSNLSKRNQLKLGRVSSWDEGALIESSMEFINPKNALKLQQSWDTLRQNVDNYEMRVGEELFLAMLEINPAIRQDMGIRSLRSAEFEATCKRITSHVEFLVSLTGPSISQDFSSSDNINGMKEDGLNPSLLASAAPVAMKSLLGPDKYTDDVADAWGYYFAKHVARMTKDVE